MMNAHTWSIIILILCIAGICINACTGEISNERINVDEVKNNIRDGATNEDSLGVDTKVIKDKAAEVVSVSEFIQEFHKQFEEEQQAAQIAKDSLETPVVDHITNPDDVTSSMGNEEEQVQNEDLVNAQNTTINSSGGETVNVTSILVSCNIGKDSVGQPVELVNASRLLNLLITESNVTNRRSSANCVALLFYARYCPFSSLAAPHFNALPRAFPDIKMAAVDAMKHHSFNTQYGIVGVPTVMLFHNGRPAAKFNDSEYTLEMFSKFISKYTGMEPQGKLFVTSADFGGPVSSVPTKEVDYCLAMSWVFILMCSVYFFSKSSWWQWIVEAVQNTWREAEAQHEHVE